jgi:FtsP/CotA-like multicopper oxidase with cupredoxin domain
MDILVEGTGNSRSSYYMRAVNSLGPGCDQSFAPPPANSALAIVHYQYASSEQIPDTTAAPFDDNCTDAPITEGRPFRASPVVTHEDIHTVNIEITTGTNSSGTLLWFENNSTFFTDFNDPVLRDVGNGERSFSDKYNIYDTDNAKYVRFVIVNNSPAMHPMHMHGQYPFYSATLHCFSS